MFSYPRPLDSRHAHYRCATIIASESKFLLFSGNEGQSDFENQTRVLLHQRADLHR